MSNSDHELGIGDRVQHEFERQGVRTGTIVGYDPAIDQFSVEWDEALSVDDRVWSMPAETLTLQNKFVSQTQGGESGD